MRAARIFQGNIDNDDSSENLRYAHSLVAKVAVLLVILVLVPVLPGYVVQTCCVEFRIYHSFFVVREFDMLIGVMVPAANVHCFAASTG